MGWNRGGILRSVSHKQCHARDISCFMKRRLFRFRAVQMRCQDAISCFLSCAFNLTSLPTANQTVLQHSDTSATAPQPRRPSSPPP